MALPVGVKERREESKKNPFKEFDLINLLKQKTKDRRKQTQ